MKRTSAGLLIAALAAWVLPGAGLLAGDQAQAATGQQPSSSTVAGYIWASSTLYEEGYDYGAWQTQDYDVTTTWTEGAPGTGYGESLYMETDPYTVITGGVICTGYYASEDLFYKNAAPTRIYIQTGNQEAYLDVTEYADTYDSGFEGYHFRFDEPLISTGSVTMTIVGVRNGWKYEDACISELRLEGYKASAETVPYVDMSTPHVSLVLPWDEGNADEYSTEGSWGDMYSNPDGIGGDGRGPDEVYGYTQDPSETNGYTQDPNQTGTYTSDPSYLDGEVVERLRGFADTLYELHCEHQYAKELEIHSEDLYSYSHAYVLNWYQAKVRDERIMYKGQYNYTYEEYLKEIVQELFETQTPAEDVQALCDYFGAVREGEMIRMNAAGNVWNNETFYLREPADAGDMMGRTLLIGSVMEYNPNAQGFVHATNYHAYFKQDPYDPNIFRFDELYVG